MPTPATEQKHTATPWHANLASICNVDGLHITAVEGYGMTTEQNRANRDFIVAAVNSHAALVSALTRLLRAFEADKEQVPSMDVLTSWETNSQAIAQARSALALATLNK